MRGRQWFLLWRHGGVVVTAAAVAQRSGVLVQRRAACSEATGWASARHSALVRQRVGSSTALALTAVERECIGD